ncbi:Phage shock protein G [Pantoea sp. Nvir]|nr:Phage shock protein G [Pantoea sp. Nvir]
MEIIFVLGFFLVLLVTGVSLLGVLAAIIIATLLMFIGCLLSLIIKLLPWLLLAFISAWICHTFFSDDHEKKYLKLLRKIIKL